MAGYQTFGKRQAPPNRLTVKPAVVDTAGMDPEMQSTLGGMRGAVGAGSQTDIFAGAKQALAGVKKLIFGSHGKK